MSSITTATSVAGGNGSLAKANAWFRRANEGGKYTTAAIFLIPVLALFTLFVVLPMIEAGYYSFQLERLRHPDGFRGLAEL